MSALSDAGRPRGLGRGLSALLGDPFANDLSRAAPAPAEGSLGAPRLVEPAPQPQAQPQPLPELVGEPPTTGAKTVPLAMVQANPGQPRTHFDEGDLRELAESIKAHGVLQPILVRPIANAPGRYEIVAGERRWRASQMLGLETIPVQIREIADGDMLEIAIIENVQRADLNPIEEALGYQALMDRFGRTQADVAEKVGKSRPHVANMLRLLHLAPDIQAMVREGKLSAGHARAILVAPDPLMLANLAIAQSLSVREIERLAQKAKEGAEPKPVPEPANLLREFDADVRALEQTLSSVLGLRVSISRKGDASGEIRLQFERLEQLDELCRRLSAG